MNRRQELADIIEGVIADDRAIRPALVAGAVIEHLEAWKDLKEADLEAMPENAVVMDNMGDVWQKRGGVWCGYEVSDHSNTRLARYGPFRVLYPGDEES